MLTLYSFSFRGTECDCGNEPFLNSALADGNGATASFSDSSDSSIAKFPFSEPSATNSIDSYRRFRSCKNSGQPGSLQRMIPCMDGCPSSPSCRNHPQLFGLGIDTGHRWQTEDSVDDSNPDSLKQNLNPRFKRLDGGVLAE